MHFLTQQASTKLGSYLAEDGRPRRGEPGMHRMRFFVGSESLTRLFATASILIDVLGPWEEAWLWLDRGDTWQPGMHLYSRLRQSYGNLQSLEDAPIHHFPKFESADLISFVAVALTNEWSFSVITSHDYGRLFVSASSGVEIWLRASDELKSIKTRLTAEGIAFEIEAI